MPIDWEEVYDELQSEKIERENTADYLNYLWANEEENVNFS